MCMQWASTWPDKHSSQNGQCLMKAFDSHLHVLYVTAELYITDTCVCMYVFDEESKPASNSDGVKLGAKSISITVGVAVEFVIVLVARVNLLSSGVEGICIQLCLNIAPEIRINFQIFPWYGVVNLYVDEKPYKRVRQKGRPH